MKLKLAFFNAVLLIFSTFQVAMAQELTVSGSVKSKSTGEALNGATVSRCQHRPAGKFYHYCPSKRRCIDHQL